MVTDEGDWAQSSKQVCRMMNGPLQHKDTWWWNRDVEKVVVKRKVCHKAWRKSKSAEDKHTLDVAKKEVYTAVLAAQESKLQEFTADLQSESGGKNCFRIARQMAREGRDVISMCCMKNDAGHVVSDADGMNNIWRKYMEKLLNVENDWDGEVDCPEVMGPHCLISEEEVAAAIKGLKMGKAAGPTGVVSEMMKAAGGFGSRWMTDLINNIVKESCIPDDWRKSILVPVYKGTCDPLVCGSYRAIKLLEQPMKVIECWKRGSDVRCQVFGFMPGKGTTDAIVIMRQVQEKHQSKKKKLYYAFVDLEKAFDRVPREVVRWALQKLGVDEWFIRTVMASYTDTCTVVRTDAGLRESFEVKVGLHQGSVLSPQLFAAVMDVVSSEARSGLPSELLRAFVIWETLLMEMVERILLLQIESEMDG